jgi:hypothetical protein
MACRAHEFDIFGVVEEIVDREVTGTQAVCLFGKSDIGNGLLTG